MSEPQEQGELPSLWLVLAMPMSLTVSAFALAFGLLIGLGLDEGDAVTTTPTTTQPSGSQTGAQVFASAGCGSCHTLSAAGADGTVGPSLDESQLSAGQIEEVVAKGRGTGMPAFSGRLDEAEIAAVAAYVSEAKGSP